MVSTVYPYRWVHGAWAIGKGLFTQRRRLDGTFTEKQGGLAGFRLKPIYTARRTLRGSRAVVRNRKRRKYWPRGVVVGAQRAAVETWWRER